jgi:hypothetical protein
MRRRVIARLLVPGGPGASALESGTPGWVITKKLRLPQNRNCGETILRLLAKLYYRISVLRAKRHASSLTRNKAGEQMRAITIDPKELARIEEFAAYFNIPVQEALNKAVAEWMDATGDVMMAFTENERRKVATRSKLTLVSRHTTSV